VKILLAHIVLCAALIAQDRLVTNRVSFLAGTTVYVSAGRKDGLADSCKALILKNQDTVAVLSMIAVSSKSSSWSVDRSSREIVVALRPRNASATRFRPRLLHSHRESRVRRGRIIPLWI
jgi:hypothetical protein